MIQADAVFRACTAGPCIDDAAGHADHRAVSRDVLDDDRICANANALANDDRAEYLGAGADHNAGR